MDGQLSSGLELLVRIGISKMAARVLVFIAEKGRVRSVEIEDSLNKIGRATRLNSSHLASLISYAVLLEIGRASCRERV